MESREDAKERCWSVPLRFTHAASHLFAPTRLINPTYSVGGAQVIKDTRPSQAEIYAKAGISADELQREGSGLLPAEPAAASPGAEHKV